LDEEEGRIVRGWGESLPSNKSNNIALCDVRVGAAVETALIFL